MSAIKFACHTKYHTAILDSRNKKLAWLLMLLWGLGHVLAALPCLPNRPRQPAPVQLLIT